MALGEKSRGIWKSTSHLKNSCVFNWVDVLDGRQDAWWVHTKQTLLGVENPGLEM